MKQNSFVHVKKQKISYQSDFELAQSFILDLKEFIKNNPNEFDIEAHLSRDFNICI